MLPSTPSEPLDRRPHSPLEETLGILRRRKGILLQAFVTILAVGILVTAMSRPVYLTWARLLVPAGSRSVSLVDSSNPIASMVAAAQPDNLATQLQVLQSRPFLDDAKKRAGIVDRVGAAPSLVRVEAHQEASVINVSVEGESPEEIAKYANAIVDLHLERTDLLATTGLKDTLDFVRREKQRAAKALVDSERRLIQFRKEHRVVQLAAEQEARAKEYVDLESRVRELESNILTTRTQAGDLRKRLEKTPIDLVQESTKENPRAIRLQEKLDELILSRQELLPSFRPTSARIRALDDQIAELKALREKELDELTVRTHAPNPERPPLQAELTRLDSLLHGYEIALNAASARLKVRRSIVDNLGPWEVEQTRLVRERDQAQAADAALADKLRNLEIQVNARMRTARVLERAFVPSTPIRPRKAVNLAIAGVLALCFGIGMAFIQEYLDDRVSSPNDLERFSYLPALAAVPRIVSGQPLLLASMPAYSHVMEAYRSLRSSIMFAALDQPVRRLLVTSANKGEGKTLTSVNLAMSMALDGKQVVLVDADLRRSSVHAVLQLVPNPGLSEVLVGLKTIDDVLQPTGTENLHVICGGAVPPNPAELLGSPAFDRVLAELSERFDLVIFDSPPCLPVTDSLILASRMDGVVFVVYAGHTRRAAIRHVEEMLTRARARVLGIVFNRIDERKPGRHAYQYYSYGYYGDPARMNGHDLTGKATAPASVPGELPEGKRRDG